MTGCRDDRDQVPGPGHSGGNGKRRVMHERIHRVACSLARARRALVWLFVCGAVGAAVGLFGFAGTQGDPIIVPAVILILWTLTGLIFVDVFAHFPPPRENSTVSGVRRFLKPMNGLYWMLVLGLSVLGFTVVDLSLHLAKPLLFGGSR